MTIGSSLTFCACLTVSLFSAIDMSLHFNWCSLFISMHYSYIMSDSRTSKLLCRLISLVHIHLVPCFPGFVCGWLSGTDGLTYTIFKNPIKSENSEIIHKSVLDNTKTFLILALCCKTMSWVKWCKNKTQQFFSRINVFAGEKFLLE